MLNKEHFEILNKGKDAWNRWRKNNPHIRPDLTGIEIAPNEKKYGQTKLAKSIHEMNVDLTPYTETYGAKNMSEKYSGYDFSKTILDGAINFNNHNLKNIILKGASLRECNFKGQEMTGLDLRGVNFEWSNLEGVKITNTDLRNSNFDNVNLERSIIINSDLRNCILSNIKVFGISAWGLKLEGSEQKNILITQAEQASITIDNLKVAQFIYLIINNSDIRDVIDTVANKAVLILGNFSKDRLEVLHLIKDRLRKLGFVPILFDFEKPLSRDLTETVNTLAHLSRFIIADLSEQRSIPHELASIIPSLQVPIKPIIVERIDGEEQYPYGMFDDFRSKYNWVLDTYKYQDVDKLIDDFKKEIIDPALAYKRI